MASSPSLTEQLRLYSVGHSELGNSILREIFPRLRQIATWKLAKRKPWTPFTPTELVGDTWLTRLQRGRWSIESREHFFGIAGQAMQQVLIDLARKQMTERRGGGAVHISLDEISAQRAPMKADAEQLVAIGMLIDKLAKEDALAAYIVRAHYVVGFDLEEIAAETGLSLRQVRYRWEKSKVWLATRLMAGRRVRPAGQDRG